MMRMKSVLIFFALFSTWIHIYADFLEDFNEEFRRTYNDARVKILATMDPLIICQGDNANIIYRGQRYQEQVIPKIYHELKTISHIPLKISLDLMFIHGNISHNDFLALKHYLHVIRSIRKSIRFPREFQSNQNKIIDLSIDYLRTILRRKSVDRIQLREFCQTVEIYVSKNIDLAARAQLEMLHSKITPWYQTRFNQTERHSLKILIIGPKTVRHGHLEKIFFYELLGERHEGRHLIYAESVDNEEQAMEILGTWFLDERIATNFFADRQRLHRDLLSDAAHSHVKQLFKEKTRSEE